MSQRQFPKRLPFDRVGLQCLFVFFRANRRENTRLVFFFLMQFVSCKTQKEDLRHSSQILGKVGNEKGGDWKVWGGCAEL